MHQPKRVGAADAGEHRRVLHDRQHLARHVDDDRIGIAVRHQARERAAPAHPVAARVVDDDQVGAACLRAFRRQAGAGAGADDRAPGLDLRPQPRERFCLVSSMPGSARAAGPPSRARTPGRSRLRRSRAPRPSRIERLARIVSNSAASASGSWNTWPSVAIAETPRNGTNSTVGPVAALSLPAMIWRPISRHSSGVVRISVIVGLCT